EIKAVEQGLQQHLQQPFNTVVPEENAPIARPCAVQNDGTPSQTWPNKPNSRPNSKLQDWPIVFSSHEQQQLVALRPTRGEQTAAQEPSQTRTWWPRSASAREGTASNFSLRSLAGGSFSVTEAEEALTSSDALCPSLTLRQRIVGWLTCFGLGVLLELTGFGRGIHALVGGEKGAERFAILYSLGNFLALVGTLFLAGPSRQLRRMGREKRWLVSLCFVCSMFLTLLVAFLPGQWHGRTLILLLLVLVQWAALIWYTLSYIPFGQRTALAALRGCWSRCLGE
ncbi:unnamed protein product, partial [Cladocopium goreaui]